MTQTAVVTGALSRSAVRIASLTKSTTSDSGSPTDY
jgi:hypothetical protein